MKRVTPVPRLGAPRETVEAPRLSSLAKARHRLHRVTVTALFVLALGFTLLVSTGTSQEATAVTNRVAIGPGKCDFAPSQNQGWEPSQPGSGSDGFLYPSEYISEGSARTPLEKYGMRGMTWSLSSYSGNVDDVASDENQECSFMAPIQNMLAQEMLTASQSVASVTIAVRQKATDASPFMRMIRDATPTTNDALKKWFIPGAGIMVALTGVWMALGSVKGERRSVIAGLGWMAMSLILVGWLMMPTSLANGRDGSECEGKECDMAFGGGTSGPDGVPEGETPIKATDPNYYALTAKANDTGNDISNAATGIFSPRTTATECAAAEDEKDSGARTLDCVLWYEMAFRPWSVGQFGGLGESEIDWTAPKDREPKPPKEVIEGMKGKDGAKKDSKKYAEAETPEEGDDVRMIMLAAQTFSWQEAAATGEASDANGVISSGSKYTGSKNRVTPDKEKEDHEIWDASTKNGAWNQVRAYMAGEQSRAYDTWSGQEAVSDRTSTAFLSLLGNILIAAFVLVTSLLTLMWFAVVVLALMALPFVGLISIFPPAQKFLRGLGQLWIKGLILAAVFTVLQVGVGAITGAVMASNSAFGWKVVLLFAAVLGLFKVAKLAREDAFTPNLNSQGVAEAADPQQAANKVSPAVAGAGFAAGRSTARVAGRGGKAVGRAAGGKVKEGGAKVSKSAQKGAQKGKAAAHRGTVKARGTAPGQRLAAGKESLSGWSADTKRGVDRKVSSAADRLPGDRAARKFNEREEARDLKSGERVDRRTARQHEVETMHKQSEASKKVAANRAQSGRDRMRPEWQAPAESDASLSVGTGRVSAAKPSGFDLSPGPQPGKTTPRETPIPVDVTVRDASSAPSSGRPAQPKVEKPGPARTPDPSSGRPAQPKVEKPGRKNPGSRLSKAETSKVAREAAASEVERKEQRKADRERTTSGRGGNGRVK